MATIFEEVDSVSIFDYTLSAGDNFIGNQSIEATSENGSDTDLLTLNVVVGQTYTLSFAGVFDQPTTIGTVQVFDADSNPVVAFQIGAAPVTKADAMTPTTAPVIMNDHMRGARRMVTSSVAMSLFSQGGKGYEFREGRPRSRCSNGPATDGLIPRFVPNREGHESRRIQFDDVGRGSSGVTKSLDELDSAVGRNTHLDRLAGRESREFLQDEPHCYGGGFPIGRTVPNRGDRDSATLNGDSGKGHAQHASSGKGSVLS